MATAADAARKAAHLNAGPRPMSADERRVIFASSLGTVFEWYDFYLFGVMAGIMASSFFSALDASTRDIFTLLAFAAGFAVRPFGAIVFGRLGDLVGRKYTFLVTILIMACPPSWWPSCPPTRPGHRRADHADRAAPLLQGLALGGEYGGAATYVAEHAPHTKRGAYTAWIQTTATVGLMLALMVILGTRLYTGEKDFADWGWRIPYAASGLLLVVSVWIRLKLSESPAFARMKSEGKTSKAPLTESFGQWSNLKIVILALLGGTAGQAVVWYTGQFYSLFFIQTFLKIDGPTANVLIALSLILGTPFFLIFGSLSDKIGRKPIIMAGCLLAALTYFPLFHALTTYGNPKLEAAIEKSPVSVVAKPGTCNLILNLTGTAKFTTACDLSRTFLSNAGVNYDKVEDASATSATVKVGDKVIAAYNATDPTAKDDKPRFEKEVRDALNAAGYPAKADPIPAFSGNWWMLILILTIMVIYVTMVYGPIAAMLVELFPTRIRYTSMSLPYHIGNGWFGGFLPAISFCIVAAQGNIYSGLWYPIIFATMTFIIGMLFLKETKDNDIYAQTERRTAGPDAWHRESTGITDSRLRAGCFASADHVGGAGAEHARHVGAAALGDQPAELGQQRAQIGPVEALLQLQREEERTQADRIDHGVVHELLRGAETLGVGVRRRHMGEVEVDARIGCRCGFQARDQPLLQQIFEEAVRRAQRGRGVLQLRYRQRAVHHDEHGAKTRRQLARPRLDLFCAGCRLDENFWLLHARSICARGSVCICRQRRHPIPTTYGLAES